MSQKLMQVNFQLTVPSDAFALGCTPEAAQPFSEVFGLQWKIWILNRETGEAGGIKLFQDEESLQTYMNGPLWSAVMNGAGWRDVQMKIFDILEIPSAVTRAPLKAKGIPGNITFNQMVSEAFAAVPTVEPADLLRWMENDPKPLIIDVQDAADISLSGTIPGAINISLGSLTYKADHELPEEWRDSRLSDHALLIVTTCSMGPLGALGAKLLHDMGFTNLFILNGGVDAWKKAGFTTVQPA